MNLHNQLLDRKKKKKTYAINLKVSQNKAKIENKAHYITFLIPYKQYCPVI